MQGELAIGVRQDEVYGIFIDDASADVQQRSVILARRYITGCNDAGPRSTMLSLPRRCGLLSKFRQSHSRGSPGTRTGIGRGDRR